MSLNVLSICRTSLHYACAHNHPDVVTLLLENNSSINIRDDEGCTPLIKVAIGHLFWHEMDRGCPCLVSLAVIKHWPKTTLGRMGLFSLYFITREAKTGTQGRNWSRDHGGMLLTGLFCHFSYKARAHLTKAGTAHSGLGPLELGCWLVYVNLTQLESSERRGPQLRKCLYKVGLKVGLWCGEHFLNCDWYGKAQPTVGSAAPSLVVLGSVRKQAEEAGMDSPPNIIPPWLLHQILAPGCHTACLGCPQWSMTWICRQRNPFFLKLLSVMVFHHSK